MDEVMYSEEQLVFWYLSITGYITGLRQQYKVAICFGVKII